MLVFEVLAHDRKLPIVLSILHTIHMSSVMVFVDEVVEILVEVPILAAEIRVALGDCHLEFVQGVSGREVLP